MTNINFTLTNSYDPSERINIRTSLEPLMALLRPYQAIVQNQPVQSIMLLWAEGLPILEPFIDCYTPRIKLNELLAIQLVVQNLDEEYLSEWVDFEQYFPALPYQIYSSWHVSDVQNQAPTLTDDEASQVLARLKTHHDSNIGINWDSIDGTINLLFSSDIRNCTRLDRMPHVNLEGYYKDEPNHIYKDGYALIGKYPENITSAEEWQDLNVMYYFESAEELKVGFEIEDFVVISWEIFDATVPTT